MNNYTPLVISRNDKNKQLTLLSQLKLALTAINFLYLKSSESLITINVPVVFMARYVMVFRSATSLRGASLVPFQGPKKS
jgi:hypothetical protein